MEFIYSTQVLLFVDNKQMSDRNYLGDTATGALYGLGIGALTGNAGRGAGIGALVGLSGIAGRRGLGLPGFSGGKKSRKSRSRKMKTKKSRSRRARKSKSPRRR